MSRQTESEGERRRSSGAMGTQAARVLTVLALNVALLLTAAVFATSSGGRLPDLNAKTIGAGLLPISAALGLVLACRRIDFSLPVILVLALALQTHRHPLTTQPILPVIAVCGLAGAVGLLSTIVTWYGRISSALWTAVLGFSLWLVVGILKIDASGPGPWPWPWALAASLGFLAAGAAVLGLTGLVSLPSLPPIVRSGSKGFVGLAGAWIIAAGGVAVASLSDAAKLTPGELQAVFPRMLAAAALGGAFVLRGRFGALAAVLLTGLAHLVWSLAWSTDMGSHVADILVPGLAPLVAIPLYLLVDRLFRQHTGESPPTGLLA